MRHLNKNEYFYYIFSTFAIIDESMQCVCVTVYNWADGRGPLIGDAIAVPEPLLSSCSIKTDAAVSYLCKAQRHHLGAKQNI